MIPSENKDHVVLELGFDRIDDLAEALSNAGIFPTKIPEQGGWGEHRQPIPRFDIEFLLQYRIRLETPIIDAYKDNHLPGGNEIRLGLRIRQVAVRLVLVEMSSQTTLSSFEYAMTGRVSLYGSLVTDPSSKAVYFSISRLPEFMLDDKSNKIPPPLPKEDMEKILARETNRDFRVKLHGPQRLPELRFPITPKLEIKGLSQATLGLALRDSEQVPDRFSERLCLPPGFGDPQCPHNQPVPVYIDRYKHLDFFARVETANDPVAINRVGRHFQIDIGSNILQRELSKDNDWKDWEEVAAKMFRFRTKTEINWTHWPGGGPDDAGIKGEVRAELQVAYPKVKWCRGWTKLPWGGRVSYKYPCGIERGWHGVRKVHLWVTVRLKIEGTKLCIEHSGFGKSGEHNIIGEIITFIYGAVLIGLVSMFSSLLSGVLAGLWLFTQIILLSIEHIVGFLLSILVPEQLCLDIQNFLKVPIVEDRVELQIERPLLEFKTTGITIACDGDFRKVLTL